MIEIEQLLGRLDRSGFRVSSQRSFVQKSSGFAPISYFLLFATSIIISVSSGWSSSSTSPYSLYIIIGFSKHGESPHLSWRVHGCKQNAPLKRDLCMYHARSHHSSHLHLQQWKISSTLSYSQLQPSLAVALRLTMVKKLHPKLFLQVSSQEQSNERGDHVQDRSQF